MTSGRAAFLWICLCVISSTLPEITCRSAMAATHSANPMRSHPSAVLPTPAWIGEQGVDAAVIVSVDDLRGAKLQKYNDFLSPILQELRSNNYWSEQANPSITIFACDLFGLTASRITNLTRTYDLQVHTISHNCPLFDEAREDKITATKSANDEIKRSIAHLQDSGVEVAAFRAPCCDSQNEAMPNAFANMLIESNLTVDSSVCVVLGRDAHNDSKQQSYLPSGFDNFITNYPYPYVADNKIWEFPFVSPSDFQFNLSGASKNKIVPEWCASLDSIVRARGTMVLLLHPNGWVSPDSVVEFIQYAAKTYGTRLKFLSIADANKRIQQNVLQGERLSNIKLVDINADGFLDLRLSKPGSRPRDIVWDDRVGRWRARN